MVSVRKGIQPQKTCQNRLWDLTLPVSLKLSNTYKHEKRTLNVVVAVDEDDDSGGGKDDVDDVYKHWVKYLIWSSLCF